MEEKKRENIMRKSRRERKDKKEKIVEGKERLGKEVKEYTRIRRGSGEKTNSRKNG